MEGGEGTNGEGQDGDLDGNRLLDARGPVGQVEVDKEERVLSNICVVCCVFVGRVCCARCVRQCACCQDSRRMRIVPMLLRSGANSLSVVLVAGGRGAAALSKKSETPKKRAKVSRYARAKKNEEVADDEPAGALPKPPGWRPPIGGGPPMGGPKGPPCGGAMPGPPIMGPGPPIGGGPPIPIDDNVFMI